MFPDGVAAGALHLKRGRIQAVYRKPHVNSAEIAAVARSVDNMGGSVLDMGSLVVSPGVIDVHVHMNEPGRLEWEGIRTATSAAVTGGVTTVVDMPLNCNPTITSGPLLKEKARRVWVRPPGSVPSAPPSAHHTASPLHCMATRQSSLTARSLLFVVALLACMSCNAAVACNIFAATAARMQNKARTHVGMWGGLTHENAHDHRILSEMLRLGAVGLKAFMCPSGIDDFPPVSPCAQIDSARLCYCPDCIIDYMHACGLVIQRYKPISAAADKLAPFSEVSCACCAELRGVGAGGRGA